jgi:hypothetical protein
MHIRFTTSRFNVGGQEIPRGSRQSTKWSKRALCTSTLDVTPYTVCTHYPNPIIGDAAWLTFAPADALADSLA